MKFQDHIHRLIQQLDDGNWQESFAWLKEWASRPDSRPFTQNEQAKYEEIRDLADRLVAFSGSAAEREKLSEQLLDLLRQFLQRLSHRSQPKGNVFKRLLAPIIDLFKTNRMPQSPPMAMPFPDGEGFEMAKPPADLPEKMESTDTDEQMSGAEPAKESIPLPNHGSPDLPETNPVIKPETGTDIVNVSVYSPETVTPGQRFLISAFAHLFEQREEVDRMAREADPQAAKQGSKTLNMPIRRGESLQFSLELEGWKVDEPVQEITWFGVPGSVEFIVTVTEHFAEATAIGVLIISNETGPVGRVKFNLSVGSEVAAAPGSFAPTDGRTYQRTYLSYAEEDLSSVSRETQAYRSQSNFVFTQPFSIQDPDWEEKTIKAIGESDLFVLFWSKAATQSHRVNTEWESALGLRYGRPERLPDILPVSLESPLPDPPGELAFLNFSQHFTPGSAAHTANAAGSFPGDSPAMLKSRCEEMISNEDMGVFDLLSHHFSQDADKQQELIMLRMQWTTIKRKERLHIAEASEVQLEKNKIVFELLAIVGEIH